jgi:hypothetical protein
MTSKPQFAMIYSEPIIAAAREHKLSLSDTFVYLAIAQHADSRTGRAYPTLERIAEITGIKHLTHVSRSIGRLEKAGLLSRTHKRGPRGTWDRSEYIITKLASPVTTDGQRTSDQTGSPPLTTDGQRTSDLTWSTEHTKNQQTKRTERCAQARRGTPDVPFDQMIEVWNSYDALPQALPYLSAKRQKALALVWQELGGTMEAWHRFVSTCAASSFLTGAGERQWRADIDWCIAIDHAVKISEGGYMEVYRKRGPGDSLYEGFMRAAGKREADEMGAKADSESRLKGPGDKLFEGGWRAAEELAEDLGEGADDRGAKYN